MNDYIDALKEEFWERIRPRSKEEIENDEMLIKVKDHYNKLIDDLLNESACGAAAEPKAVRLEKLKHKVDSLLLELSNVDN